MLFVPSQTKVNCDSPTLPPVYVFVLLRVAARTADFEHALRLRSDSVLPKMHDVMFDL